ncbi:SDR family oxidoreductase [Fodinicola feengrottensis]|nr:SDR family oxidoreductase [Fodinicola feengrottensis]
MSIANDDSPVVLVTGGGSGIGRATALLLAREGWRVVVTGRQEDTLWEVADQNPNIRSITSDLAFADRATVSVDFAISAYGRLDALVNNAGMHVRMPTEETDFEAITEMLAINLIGPARLVTASIPHLAKTGGSIVNVSSALGQLPSLASGFLRRFQSRPRLPDQELGQRARGPRNPGQRGGSGPDRLRSVRAAGPGGPARGHQEARSGPAAAGPARRPGRGGRLDPPAHRSGRELGHRTGFHHRRRNDRDFRAEGLPLMTGKRILIIGAGIAGLALATGLRRRGASKRSSSRRPPN